MKISLRLFNIIFQVLVAIIMSACIAFFMIAVYTGFDVMFPVRWLSSFGLSLIVALPLSLFVVPLLRQGLTLLFEIDYATDSDSVFQGVFVKMYDKVSKSAFTEMYDILYDRVHQATESGRILDVGCGTGVCAINIAKDNNYQVAGVDSSKAMIKMSQKNAREAGLNVDFRVAPGHALPFDDASFDMVVSNGSLHHWEKPVESLNEIYRVLKPGGIAFINDLRRDLDRDDLIRIVASKIKSKPIKKGFIEHGAEGTYTREELLALAEKSRFTDLNVIQKIISLEATLKK